MRSTIATVPPHRPDLHILWFFVPNAFPTPLFFWLWTFLFLVYDSILLRREGRILQFFFYTYAWLPFPQLLCRCYWFPSLPPVPHTTTWVLQHAVRKKESAFPSLVVPTCLAPACALPTTYTLGREGTETTDPWSTWFIGHSHCTLNTFSIIITILPQLPFFYRFPTPCLPCLVPFWRLPSPSIVF